MLELNSYKSTTIGGIHSFTPTYICDMWQKHWKKIWKRVIMWC